MKLHTALLLTFIFAIQYCTIAQYDIRSVRSIDGLSTRTITVMQQDQDGFIWIGTRNGLVRFDGFELKEYDLANSGIVGDDISSIVLDHKGRLWVGSINGGLNLYNRKKDSFRHFENYAENTYGYMESEAVRAMHEDAEGNIWIATKHGLSIYNELEDNFTCYSDVFQGILLKDIESDHMGNIWCGTFGAGLFKFDTKTKTFEKFLVKSDGYGPKIQTLKVFSETQVLLGTRDEGLLVYDIDQNKLSSFFDENHDYFEVKNIWEIFYEEAEQKLWIGSDGYGLLALEYSEGEWTDLQFIDSYLCAQTFSNAVYSLMKDNESNLWVGTGWQGLYVMKYLKNELTYLRDFVGDQTATVWTIFEDGKDIWLGTDGEGLFVHSRDLTNRSNISKQYFEDLKIVSIHKRDDGHYWLGSYSNGLLLVNRQMEVLEQYAYVQEDSTSVSANDIRDVLPDGEKGYWVATWGGGLNYFNNKTKHFEDYRYDANDLKTISNDNVVNLAAADSGKIWVATFGGGVNLFDPETKVFTRIQNIYTDRKIGRFSSKNLTTLYDDQNGYLWLGTWTSGINRMNIKTGEVTRFEQYEALAEKTICGILEDNEKNIWFNTIDGIYKYDVLADTIFSFPDLVGDYHFGASLKDENGKLYFGGRNGVIAFEPDMVGVAPDYPEVKITGFKLFNKEKEIDHDFVMEDEHLKLINTIDLEHDQSVITFEFAALDLPFSDKCTYSIKLEGFDKEWRNIGFNRSATYTNLSPGNYTFKVRSKSYHSSFPDQYSQISLHISKPYWVEWWAYLIYTAVIVLLLYLYRHYTLHWDKMRNQLKLEQLNREKDAEMHELKLNFFTNISHEIRTPVTLMLGAINRMADLGITGKPQQNSLETVRKNGNHLLNLVNELLDFRKLESGEAQLKLAKGNFTKFVNEVYLSFYEMSQKKNIEFEFVQPKEPVMIWFDRDEMEKVLYNLIGNAFKFTSSGGSIVVTVNANDQAAFVRVDDTGKGISAEEQREIFKRFYQCANEDPTKVRKEGYGLGLSISYDIVQLHGGDILVESEVDRGTTFTVKLPLSKDNMRSEFLMDDFQDSEQLGQYMVASTELTDSVQFNFPDQQDMSILIAEDNPGIREYLSDILSPHFQVIMAENGKVALDKTMQMLPDLILSDVMMPEMDGITFTSKVKNDPRTSHIPIIILTARTSLIFKKEGLDLGVDDYVTKPFNETLLKTRIKNILQNRQMLRNHFTQEQLTKPAELALRSPDQEFLSNLSSLIEEHMGDSNLNIDFIARELGMSQSNIYKKLKALTGMSIVEFIRDFRLKHAAQLLTRQKLPITEVCYKIGFNDRRYFSQVFKNKYGMTPSQYAKEHLEEVC